MKLIKTAIPNHYVNADSILELHIEKGGEVVSEEYPGCYKILAVVQSQSYPIVLGAYDTEKSAINNLNSLAKQLSTTKPIEMRGKY